MTLQVNDTTRIERFNRLGIFKDFLKYGQAERYELFNGFIGKELVEGYICLWDNRIYKLKYI